MPLVFESFSWQHGVFVGACLKSEATAAAEFKGRVVMHDPMAMRPFMGYNFGSYLQHWLNFNNGIHKVIIKYRFWMYGSLKELLQQKLISIHKPFFSGFFGFAWLQHMNIKNRLNA